MRLGEWLLAQKHITPLQLEQALTLQQGGKARLGQCLLTLGYIHALTLMQALAAQRNGLCVDLRKEPCDPACFSPADAVLYLELKCVPWRVEADGTLWLAATETEIPRLAEIPSLRGRKLGVVLATLKDIEEQVALLGREALCEEAVHKLWRFSPQRSARYFLEPQRKRRPRTLLVALAVLLVASLFFMPTLLGLLVLINGVYLLALLFKVQLFFAGLQLGRKPPPEPIAEEELPTYTILVPMFKEPRQTIKNLLQALQALDYPKEKIDIKLIVEEDDAGTWEAVLAEKPPAYFHILRVPYSVPRTKPKACNYALLFARGELATIYDAEDAPHPQQLKQAAALFRQEGRSLGCVQARLNYYNRKDNLLTQLFALEYTMWFDAMLKGLQRFGMPMPLGGTSNHFRTRVLKAIHGWDPFNVTEDADLGVRLAEAGFRTQVLDSLTLEEAPNTLPNWIRQRTRWVKGYIQTFVVHLREPRRTWRILGAKGVIGFILFVGSASFAFIVTPFILAISLLFYFSAYALPAWLASLLWFNLLGGLLAHLIIALVLCWRQKWWDALLAVPVFPLYWCLHSIASIRAVIQLVSGRIHLWEKTVHGLFKSNYLTERPKLGNPAPL